jgi:hypothetical protein
VTRREKLEFVGSVLWFPMDGLWMLEYIRAATVCFAAVLLLIAAYGLSALKLRRIRLPR